MKRYKLEILNSKNHYFKEGVARIEYFDKKYQLIHRHLELLVNGRKSVAYEYKNRRYVKLEDF